LQEKSQTQETLKGFLRWAQNEFGLRIKNIRSDNGTEFKNSQIEGFLEDEGIKHEFSSPYTPQQNGVVERKCWGLVLKCYELRTRQHKMLNINALRPLKHYLPKDLMSFKLRS
jgi:transposase